MDVLRIATAGSVDDGKSTLLGRLLYDTKSIFEDQLVAVTSASHSRGSSDIELALLTDGLRAEREQNITIDVAYRYFSTETRQFILADSPGHAQYTRNMVTAASTADLAIILIDARKGVLDQSRRHAAIASLLKIPNIVVAINKMDLVDYNREVFERIRSEFTDVAEKLKLPDATFIPLSALIGDNVVNPSSAMEWYDGPSLLEHLESVPIATSIEKEPLRLPIQCVIRPNQDYRGFAGTIESGEVRVGDEVRVFPTLRTAKVKSLQDPDGVATSAGKGMPVIVTLDQEIDLSRGDMIASVDELPRVATSIGATVCWFDEVPLKTHFRLLLAQTTRQVFATATSITTKLNVETLELESAEVLEMNDISRIKLHLSKPIFADLYSTRRETGGFILIDPHTSRTVGAGMIEEIYDDVPIAKRHSLGEMIWLQDLDPTVLDTMKQELSFSGHRPIVLEDEAISTGINADQPDQGEKIRRMIEIARLLARQGQNVIIRTAYELPVTVPSEVFSGLEMEYQQIADPSSDPKIRRILT